MNTVFLETYTEITRFDKRLNVIFIRRENKKKKLAMNSLNLLYI